MFMLVSTQLALARIQAIRTISSAHARSADQLVIKPHQKGRTLLASFPRLPLLYGWTAVVAIAALSHQRIHAQADTTIRFADVTADSGIHFVHSHGGGGEGYIVEGMSTGIATLDYDGDGLVDIYFLNGAALKGTTADKPLTNALYRNNGDWTFTDVTDEAGVGDTGYGLGVAAGDYDGDGDLDLYVNNFGPNVLYRNNGDRTFTDVTEEAGVTNGNQVGAGVGFLDIEGDGDLDLYVANYVNFTYDNHIPIIIGGQKYQAGPQYYQPVPDTLYRNLGNGKFEDVSQASGISGYSGPGMGLVCADFDEDGDTDVYVCNDGQPNFLFQNDGQGVFEEVGLLMGAGCDSTGKANSSMGVDCGDYDQDGLLDLFVTNYQAEMPILYRNLGSGLFEDATSKAGIPRLLFPHVNWGTAFVDLDNDADDDIYIACGHFDRIEEIDDRTSMKVRNFILANQDGKYWDVTEQCGPAASVAETSRGIAMEDFDNDGDIDCVVLNSNAAPNLLRNDTSNGNHWIKLQLSQPGMNAFAVGAQVTVTHDQGQQLKVCMSGRGYQSHFGTLLHFGLGQSEEAPKVEIRWPDGEKQMVEVKLDQLNVIERITSSKE